MKKIVKLTESDLNNLVKKVIEEQAAQAPAPQAQAAPAQMPSCSQFKKFIGEGIDTNIGSYFYPQFDASGAMVLYGANKVTGRSDKGQQVQALKDQPFCKC